MDEVLVGWDKIEKLSIIRGALTEIQDDCIPPNLKELFICDCTLLTKIGNLPKGLELLQITNTDITTLPKLPEGLLVLKIRVVPISETIHLPNGLICLNIRSTKLKWHGPLPSGLKQLYCDKSLVETIDIPDGLVVLNEQHASFELLKRHNKRLHDLNRNPVVCLPHIKTVQEIRKQHECWRFRLDGPEWNAAVQEMTN